MKEQNRDPGIMESSNLTDAKFETLVIKMPNELSDKSSENFNRNKNDKNGNGNYYREPVRNEEHIT